MVQIKARTKKWGNSIGVIIPNGIAASENIKPEQEIDLIILKKPSKIGDFFGILKGKKFDAQKFKDEIRLEEAKNELFSGFIRDNRNPRRKH